MHITTNDANTYIQKDMWNKENYGRGVEEAHKSGRSCITDQEAEMNKDIVVYPIWTQLYGNMITMGYTILSIIYRGKEA